MDKLSEISKKRILDAVEKTSALIASGEDPNDAIVKVAGDDQVPAGHIHLMVNAVNTGCTNAQRLMHDDPTEKAATFKLAELSPILERLYPEKTQTKAAVYIESFVAKEFDKAPDWLNVKAARVKAAQQWDWKLTDKTPVVERDPTTAVKKALAAVRHLEIDVEGQRLKLASIRNKAINLTEDLRYYFKQPGHIPYAEVLENSTILFGKQAEAVMTKCAELKNSNARRTATPVSLTDKPYSLIKAAIDLAAQFKLSQEALSAAEKTANDETQRLMRPFARGPEMGHSVLASQCLPMLKAAGPFTSFITRGLGAVNAADIAKEVAKKLPTSRPTSDLEKGDLSSLMDPAHEMEIRNIQSEALLNDLMANDEVIRGHDPEEVIDAYNEVSQLVPFSSNKKAIVRDLIRKRLSGGANALEQFGISDITNTQEKLRNMGTIQDPQLNMLRDIGAVPSAASPTSTRSVLR